MKDKIQDRIGASRFSLVGQVAPGNVGFLLAACSGLLSAEKPYLLRASPATDHSETSSAECGKVSGKDSKPGECVITDPITFKGKAATVKSEGGAEVTTIRRSETPANPERAGLVIFESGE